ncbi:unnamed protein product, partial [Cladocopium goreaui]
MFLLMFLGILAVRRLMKENVLLKENLQKRSVELGAVSSYLLTPCYDAVVEVDQNFRLTQDSGQLASMLLQTAPKADGLSGKSLLDFFSEGDRQRISEQVFSSVQRISVVALNADMLDSDFNHVKVELFCAQFKNLANERCFLVGLRELQDVDPPHVTPIGHSPSSSPSIGRGEALLVVFDLHTFHIHIMNGEMQRLCQAYLGDTAPDNILDIASQDTRLSLCRELQNLGNAIAERVPHDIRPATVTFDLLGHIEAQAYVTIEHDPILDAWMGSMVMNLPSDTLTESSLRNLPSHKVGMTASDSRLGVNAVTQALPVPKAVHFVQINRILRRVPIPSVTCISWARCALRSLACEWRCEIYVLRSYAQPLCESRRVKKVWMTIDGLSEPLGLTVLQSWYQLQSTLFGPAKSFHVELEFLASVGKTFAKINFQEPMSMYQGTRRLDAMLYQLMTNEIMQRLKHQGEKYLQAATSTPYMHYARGSFYSHGRSKHAALSDGRVMLDTQRGQDYGHHAARGGDLCSLALQQAMKAFKLQMKHGTESLRIVHEPTAEELWMAWPALVGFSFTAKCWGQVLVSETSPIEFRADAFEQLVLPAATKEIIKSAVRHASSSGLDFISGKGDNTIFLLYGPPGCGKTLTAEAIAEMLRMPLYVVTAGDLGITAQEVEQNLSQ